MTTTVRTADGAELAVQIRGTGPAVLLLPGQANSHRWWDGLRDRFEPRSTTVTFDYRGTGSTTAPDGDWSTASFADDAIAVLDALGLERSHVYGASMGGRVAQVLAARHPRRVDRLVLACTSPGGPHAAERSQDVRRALADRDETRRTAALVDLFYTPAWGSDATRSHLLGDPSMSAADRRRHLRVSARHDAWDLLPTIVAPTLVLHGDDDRMAPVDNAHLIGSRIPDAWVVVTAGGRHGFFDERADEVHAEIEAFLSAPATGRRPDPLAHPGRES